MEKKLSHPKPPKEKKTVHGAIQGFIANGQTMNANTIAKAVGVSRHRVLKYCRSHGIELDKLNSQVEQGISGGAVELQTTTPEVKALKTKKKAAIQLAEPTRVKIQLATPNQVKIKLNRQNT